MVYMLIIRKTTYTIENINYYWKNVLNFKDQMKYWYSGTAFTWIYFGSLNVVIVVWTTYSTFRIFNLSFPHFVYRIQEINKITKRRLKEVKFFKQRLLNNYVEDWTVVPVSDTNLDEDEDDNKFMPHLISKDKVKEEKNEEGML